MLCHDAGVGQHWHKVCVPIPAWNDVQVDVSFDAGTGGSAEVEASICAVRLERSIEYRQRLVEQFPQLSTFNGIHFARGGEVAIGRNQDMPVRVRIEIENHETGRPAVQD